MKSVGDADDFLIKPLKSSMFALNQGEICTCPSRLLVHEDIYEKFKSNWKNRAIKMGNLTNWTCSNSGLNFIGSIRKKNS
jgi:aldehyde dehydrogenase